MTLRSLLSFDWIREDPGPPYVLVLGVPLAVDELVDWTGPVDAFGRLIAERTPVLARHRGERHFGALLPAGWLQTAGTDRMATMMARDGHALVVVDGPLMARSEVVEDYARLLDCLDGMIRLVGGQPGTVCPADASAISALRTVPLSSRVEFVRQTIGPLLALPASRSAPLLDVLATMRRGGRGALARRMGVHRTSATYRLRRIRELTQLDPGRPGDRLRLLLGFDLYVLDLPSMPPPGPHGGWQRDVRGGRRRFRTSEAG